ncbi:MFS transporter [Tumebacillus flagellatus]|uniref:Fosmidomycin resistance protein n=1 Tax=Tumebacillus flagellatus TaxID=1157490 RepID=A0A074LJT9_9BACL|nr:MFS transporter [Tumebacillus flagellatus]KEO82431.1 Fosmidomycin resistance protein [Tumebacillus flagellatus]
MQTVTKPLSAPGTAPSAAPTVYRILLAISLVHLLNDAMQAVVPALYPILEKSMALNYTQVGLISFFFNMTSSIMQPGVGFFTDKRPSPFLLPLGMLASMAGMVGLAVAPSFGWVLFAAMFVGLGSAVFHPEGSRVAHMAAGARKGFAQSIYQVGGNTGQSLAPLMTALIFVPLGQPGAAWFTLLAGLAIFVLFNVSKWYRLQLATGAVAKKGKKAVSEIQVKNVKFAIALLVLIVFARSWYSSAISNFYQFFLMEKFHLEIAGVQKFVFLFMLAGAVGTFFGGPLADRFGKWRVILFSLVGAAPFAVVLPHVSLFWAYPLLLCMGAILSSSFSVTVVYAQELIPGAVGLVSGLITGLAFGMGAIGAVALGKFADIYGLSTLMTVCSVLPLLGLLTFLLPKDEKSKKRTSLA